MMDMPWQHPTVYVTGKVMPSRHICFILELNVPLFVGPADELLADS